MAVPVIPDIPQGNTVISDPTTPAQKQKINTDGSVNVNPQGAAIVSGTLQNAAVANGVGTPLALVGDATIILTVNMVGFTGTVNFEGTEDGTDFGPLEVEQFGVTAGLATTAVGATSTSILLYTAACSGLQKVQARVSGYSAGNVTVTAHADLETFAQWLVSANLVVGSTPSVAPADNLALAGQFAAVQMGQTGTGVTSVERFPNKILNVPGTAITAGTPVSIWTPASGKKFRLLGYHLSSTVASSLIFKDGTTGGGAVEFMRTPIQAINTGTPSPPLGNGFLSAAANNQLWLDATASGTVHGFAIGMEE